MSIRRIGFNPFVNHAAVVEAQRRIEAVEKHAGTEDTELRTEEDVLESLNAEYRAELEAAEAERALQAQQASDLRAQLTLKDGFEKQQAELVDLKGGVEEPVPELQLPSDSRGMSLASLARANVYQTVSRAEQRDAARRAELEAAAARQAELEATAASDLEGLDDVPVEVEVEGVDEDWMRAELSALDARNDSLEEVDEAGEAHADPGADMFLASLEDIENLEESDDSDLSAGNGFFASLDDIAELVPETAPEPLDAGAPMAAEPSEMPPAEVAAQESMASLALPFDDEGAPAPQLEAAPMSEADASVALPFDSEEGPGSPV